jgi:hypothetical protein
MVERGGFDVRFLLITALVLLLVNIALVVLYIRGATKEKDNPI